MFPNDKYPSKEYLQFFVDRTKQCDLSSIETYLAVVRIAGRFQNRSEAYFQKLDLSQGRFLILMMLLKNEDTGMTPADIAQNMACARATVTGLLDTLESAGFIERHADPNGDRRSLTIRLTEAGRAKIDGVLPGHHRRIRDAVSDFSQAEREQLIHLLTKFSKGLDAFEAIIDAKEKP